MFALFASVLLVTIYSNITIFPSDNPCPTTPSPKYISNLPSSTSCKKYEGELAVTCDISVANI